MVDGARRVVIEWTTTVVEHHRLVVDELELPMSTVQAIDDGDVLVDGSFSKDDDAALYPLIENEESRITVEIVHLTGVQVVEPTLTDTVIPDDARRLTDLRFEEPHE
jgi:hypothetical protein